LRFAETQGITVDINDCFSACGVCRKVMTAINKAKRVSNGVSA